MAARVIPLFEGDQRCQRLLETVLEVIYERGKGLPLPAVLGVVRLVEYQLIVDHDDDQ